jgi:hypothetical protein
VPRDPPGNFVFLLSLSGADRLHIQMPLLISFPGIYWFRHIGEQEAVSVVSLCALDMEFSANLVCTLAYVHFAKFRLPQKKSTIDIILRSKNIYYGNEIERAYSLIT